MSFGNTAGNTVDLDRVNRTLPTFSRLHWIVMFNCHIFPHLLWNQKLFVKVRASEKGEKVPTLSVLKKIVQFCSI